MTITHRILALNALILESCKQFNRSSETIKLIAVSKGQSVEAIEEAYAAGVRHFGENYWQEAAVKIKRLQHLPIVWHFIGPLQSNKAKEISLHFSWVHTVDREKIALLLSKHRPDHFPNLNVCLQVNLDDETSKSGVPPQAVKNLAERVYFLPRLNLRGLMTIPQPRDEEEQQYLSFQRLAHLQTELNSHLALGLDTLSMGMSNDIKAAMKAGSTFLRIGRAIFGERI